MAIYLQYLKYSIRTSRKSLGVTSIVLLTLALGVGLASAGFSVVEAIMLTPLPYRDAAKIVVPIRLAAKDANIGYGEIPWGITSFHRIQRDGLVFQSIAAFKGDSFNLTGAGQPVFLEGVKASAEFFSVLGVQPLIGRSFTSQEDVVGHDREVLLSHELWRSRFLEDKKILSRTINLNGQPYSVVGVMPPDFTFPHGEEMPASYGLPRRAQLWIPLALPAVAPEYTPDELAIVARLKPGITVTAAQANLNVLKPRLEEDVAGGKGWFDSRVTSLSLQVSGQARTPLLLMFAAMGLLLLIGCSNVANLLLARCLARSAEFSLRIALGADRRHLISLLLTESLVLALAGGLLGLLLAQQAIEVAKVMGPANLPRLQEASLDMRVFAFAIGTSLMSALVFGLVPALVVTHGDLAQFQRLETRSGSGARVSTARNTLLVFEVGLALVLLVASALIAQTFFRLVRVDPGFRAEHVLTFQLSLPASGYKDDNAIVRLYTRALERLHSLPGVQSVGLTEMLPMDGAPDGTRVRIPDLIEVKDKFPIVNYTIASPEYFAAIGTLIVHGRSFLNSDTARSRPVVVISQNLADRFFPGKDPVGRQVAVAGEGFPLMTIIGIARDIKHLSLREDSRPEIWVPFTQNPFPSMRVMQFALRTAAEPTLLIPSVETAIRSLDAGLPVAKITTLREIVNASIAGQRFSMILLGCFALVSVVLASSGMYGVISYSVNQRIREIGVRMALGATRGKVLGMVLGQGMRLVTMGIVTGLLAAIGLMRLMTSLLYGVRPTDTYTFLAVVVTLTSVAAIACYLPARRATRIDPMRALRRE